MGHHDVEIGTHTVWGAAHPFFLSAADRAYHLYIVGRSGMGKTTLLKELLRQHIEAGAGCALIDPHGDVADTLLELIPRHRVRDVAYIDPTLTKYRTVINPFYRPPEDENARALIGYNVVSTFKHLFHESWSDTRLQYILTNTVLALLDARDELRPTLASIPVMLGHEGYRMRIVGCVRNKGVRRFFEDEVPRWGTQYLNDALGPVLNRVGQFLTHPGLRQMFGTWKPTIDFADIINNGRILIVRIPKGVFGEEPTNYFGSFAMTGLQVAAMARAKTPEADRRPFELVVDEFQNFGTDIATQMLSEARKFGLSLTIAHQFMDQLEATVRDAVFGNVGSYIAFRVGEADAKILAREIGGFSASTYSGLGRGQVVAQLLEGSTPGNVLLGQTNPPSTHSHGQATKIKAQSRKRYCVRAETADRLVTNWLAQFA